MLHNFNLFARFYEILHDYCSRRIHSDSLTTAFNLINLEIRTFNGRPKTIPYLKVCNVKMYTRCY
jgi:hypothetical protein